jgi:WD40 repeat protein
MTRLVGRFAESFAVRWLRGLLILAVALTPPLWLTFLQARKVWPVCAVSFSPDGRALATLCAIRVPELCMELRVWDVKTGRERRSERRVYLYPLLVITDDERLVARAVNGSTRLLAELVTWPERLLLESDVPNDFWSALSPDARILATARHRPDWDRDTRVHLWEVATGRLIKSLDDGQFVDALAFSPDSRLLAGVSSRLIVWNVEPGGAARWSISAPQYLRPLSFAPDGLTLAAQTDSGKLDLVDLDSRQARGGLNYSHTDSLAFSPDGRRLAVADDQRVTIWDVRSLKRLAQFTEHVRPQSLAPIRNILHRTRISYFRQIANTIWALAFSVDGTLVGSCDEDGTARVWDSATGREQLRLYHYGDPPIWPRALAWTWAACWGVGAFLSWNRKRRSAVRERSRRELTWRRGLPFRRQEPMDREIVDERPGNAAGERGDHGNPKVPAV